MTLEFLIHKTILYSIKNKKENKDKKLAVAAFDLDHTLVKPKSGRTHPKDKDDIILFDPKVITILEDYHKKDYQIVIFSNQDDLLNKPDRKEIVLNRLNLFMDMLEGNNIDISILISTSRDFCRKPNTGMWNYFQKKINYEVDLKKSFYVGDAAGRIKEKKNKKDFSCSDRMFAHNIALTFYTPEVFFCKEKDRKFEMPNLAEELFGKNKNDDKNPSVEELSKYSVIMLVGAPASGKSTLAKKFNKDEFNFISQDDLKTKSKCLKKMEELSKEHKKIIINNTNCKIKNRKEYLTIIKKYYQKEEICCIITNINKEQSFFLNNYRCKIKKDVRLADVVIHTYFKYYEEPQIEEGFNKIYKWNFVLSFNNKNEEKLFYQYY
jgi:bifunctional polynucleotide phosphatase/kinase